MEKENSNNEQLTNEYEEETETKINLLYVENAMENLARKGYLEGSVFESEMAIIAHELNENYISRFDISPFYFGDDDTKVTDDFKALAKDVNDAISSNVDYDILKSNLFKSLQSSMNNSSKYKLSEDSYNKILRKREENKQNNEKKKENINQKCKNTFPLNKSKKSEKTNDCKSVLSNSK